MDLAISAELDMVMGAVELEQDSELLTAVLVSLLSDARTGVEGGWWGAELLKLTAWGSKLWLLSGRTLTAETLRIAEQYALEALAWLVTEGLAESVKVSASRGAAHLVLRVELGKRQKQTMEIPIPWSRL